MLEPSGWQLRPRLCVHGRWLAWLPEGLRRQCQAVGHRLRHLQGPLAHDLAHAPT